MIIAKEGCAEKQEWTSTEDVAGVDIAGVNNNGGKAQEVDTDGVDFTELS